MLPVFILNAAMVLTQVPDAPVPKQPAPIHRFYDRPAKAMLAMSIAGATFDTVQTCHGLSNGFREEWLPTQHCPMIALYIGLGVVGQEFVAWEFHKHGHHKLERITRLYMPINSTIGLTISKRNGSF